MPDRATAGARRGRDTVWPRRPARSSTPTSTRSWRSESRPASASSIACSAAASCRDRWCCIGGEPGIGKSTLLLQAAAHFAQDGRSGPLQLRRGIRAPDQVARRAARRRRRAPLYLLAETCLERILEEIARLRPALLIVDSIQTVFSLKFQSAPGSIGQVREAATQLLFAAKGQNIPTFLVGHVTKDGTLAGPEVARAHRRHGAVLRRREAPLAPRRPRGEEPVRRGQRARRVRDDRRAACAPVPNPSELFLAERRAGAPGSAVLCCVEGSRPMLVEVQALVSTSTYGNARRTASGLDQNRLSLLLAVLEKRAGLNLVAEDVFVNVAGGIAVDEPAADLAIVGRGRLERAQPAACGPAPRSSARSGSPARCAGSARPRCACARRRRWASRAACCPTATAPRRTCRRACELVRGPDRGRGARRADRLVGTWPTWCRAGCARHRSGIVGEPESYSMAWFLLRPRAVRARGARTRRS